MTDLRTAAQQTLEALLTPSGAQACSTCQEGPENEYCCRIEMWSAVAALRAALAQQDESVDADAAYQRWLADTHAPALRRMDSQGAFSAGWQAALAQQAEPVEEPITRLFGTLPVHDTQQALAQQENPKPMSPEQRQRWEELAAMPQQAEPGRLHAQRDALLEALKGLMQQYKDQPECFMDWSKARAAIKAVEEPK